MGNNKIIKSAAAVALTASVVATAAAPQASAAAYKVNKKNQLVSSTTGKLVKGWKVFGGKLYKNGKLAPAKKYKIIGKGAAQRLYYGPTLKKGYKTANSKTLLFKDGKLADGWKQAGKNERLYKNGKLDKGYTVYTNIEGDKFLYQNGRLKKGDKTATRGGETLLFTDGLLSKGVKEFKGKTYNNGKLANGLVNGKEYENGVLVTSIESAKSLNSTTVEVTFKKELNAADLKAADFTIEGLTVSNAVIKQSDAKTVVLTTSAQEAGKEYTVAYAGNTAKFTAVNSAIPTAIKSTEVKPYQTSQQAKIGEQVTVKASVTVAEGASKAGIPVTFVIDNNTDTASGNVANQGKDITVEVLTDENGVASYTYTQYAASTDSVTAYATGAPTQRTTTNVFWGVAQPLSVTDITEGASLANDSKKVYKVAGAANTTYAITFAENYEVTPDKVDTKAKIESTYKVNENNVEKTVNFEGTPFQSSISGQPVASKVAKVKTNEKGEATFTVTGGNTSVTPVVFVDSVLPTDRLNQTELQATASTVTFSDIKTVGLTNEAQGLQQASAGSATAAWNTGKMEANQGGRTYVATLTDNEGKTAAKGTKVYLTLDPVNTSKDAKFHVYDAKGVEKTPANGVYALETDENGKVTYVIASEKVNSYATPIVSLDNGTTNNAPTVAKGEMTYFGDAKVAKAQFKVEDKDAKDGITVRYANNVVVTYQTIDQNGFPYAPAAATKVAFNFNTTFGTLAVDGSEVAKSGNTNNKALELTTDATGQIKFNLSTDVDTTANITASGNLVEVSNASAKVVFDKVGKTPTTTVTTAELAGVNAATTTAQIKEALKNNDFFAALKDEEKDALADTVLAQLKAGKTYNGAELAKAIDAAKGQTPAPEAQVKTTALEAAIKGAKEALETVPAANKEALEAAIKTAEAALAAKESQEKVDAATTALNKAVEDAKKEESTVTIKDLGEAATVKNDGLGQITISIDKTKLSDELKEKTTFKVVIGEETITLTKNVINPNKLYGEVSEKDYTIDQVNDAKVVAE